MNLRDNAFVLCIDEKSQIQALERSQPVLPMRPGCPGRWSHDYYRHGTTSLFAALEVATGSVIGATKSRHRSLLRGFPWILSRAEIEFAEEEKDSGSEVVEEAEARASALMAWMRELRPSAVAFKPVMMIVKEIEQVTLDPLGRGDHWLEPRAHCTGPLLEKLRVSVRWHAPKNGETAL